ncbi:cytochrome P450 [Pseudaminobacter arsenicus]|uniref:Cytochrome P450 n=1 Tax=Borborobacter arsenicus TaxID=1851146 RepID=A0A432UYU5_9HYPH|nr:cytochrome P450 [Pseudaminobacter arsenicus]RUM95114.1 cytochrome P450 [Pseudaminobacter arsenicus]
MNLMLNRPPSDWNPRSDSVLSDQTRAYDRMRRCCPVAHSDYSGWSLFRHEDVVRVLDDHDTFSNVVSSHLSVPNGMDPPEHTRYRQMIESYFASDRVEAFEPLCQAISTELVSGLQRGAETEMVTQFAQLFALRIQCAFLGWPQDLHEPLRCWIQKNHEATLARNAKAMAAIALEFDGYIGELLEARRRAGAAAPDDATTSLLRQKVGDRFLTQEEIVSILRNWTVGELGTIAACVGILVYYLAENPPIQAQIRENPSLLPAAIDEVLRIHAPLVSNRRVATRSVEIGGRQIAAGERITLMWASANRDEAVFGNPYEFRLDREPAQNLLYGAGIHVCPGAALARLELRIIMEELLAQTKRIRLAPGEQPVKALYPAGGFSSLYVAVL